MVHMQNFTSRVAAAAVALLMLASTACSKDDDKQTTPTGGQEQTLTLASMTGSYTGTFDFTASPSSLNPDPQPQTGVAVAFDVTDQGAIHFPEFPAATLVKALLGEENASALLPMLGTITYDVTIGTPTADASKLSAPLTTPQLRIDLQGVMVVLITIEAPEQLVYASDGSVQFTLKTTKCQLGEGESAGEPFDLVNELKFSAKKQ